MFRVSEVFDSRHAKGRPLSLSFLTSGPSRANTEKAFRTAMILLAGANGHGVAGGGRGVRQRKR